MRGTFASALVFLAAVSAGAQDPRREDFAYEIAVRPSVEAPLYRARLPLAVYRSITRSDLGDLRVFNASGALVPHELWSPPDETETKVQELEARVFPLLSTTPEELSAIRVEIEGGAERTSLSVARGGESSGLAAYVLDTGSIDPSYVVERLILHWAEPKEGFVLRLRVEQSDDLSSWRTLASAVVADLKRDGERLLRNEIPLGSGVARYLRVTSDDRSLPMALGRATLELTTKTERVETVWLEIRELRSEEDELVFETPGPILVEKVDVLPSEMNTWTEVQLFSRPDAPDGPDGNAPWVRRAGSAVYRFEVEREELAETRLDVRGTRDRHWRIATDGARGGFGRSLPAIRVGYRPDDVVFVARGEPPFEIAFGSRGVGPPPRGSESLRALSSSDDERLVPSTGLALGEPRTLAGERALSAPLVPDWKRFVLWGILGAASLALLLLALAALRAPGAR